MLSTRLRRCHAGSSALTNYCPLELRQRSHHVADKFPNRPRAGVIALSIGAFFGLNVVALLACYLAGFGVIYFLG